MDALQYLLPSRDTASVFDVVLLDRLGLQLRPAFDYAFNLLIPRFAVPARALESVRNRAWLLTAVYAQLHCLSTYGGSVEETLYGWRRGGAHTNGNGSRHTTPLTRKQLILSLLSLVVVPHLRQMVQQERERAAAAAAAAERARWAGDADAEVEEEEEEEGADAVDAPDGGAALYVRQSLHGGSPLHSRLVRVLRDPVAAARGAAASVRATITAALPHALAVHDGLQVLYLLAFATRMLPFPSPWMHAMGLVLQRSGAPQQPPSQQQQQQVVERKEGRMTPQAMFFRWVRITLLLWLVTLKLLEWWVRLQRDRDEAEAEAGGGRAWTTLPPPPPPPPAPAPAAATAPGQPLPQLVPDVCPLCSRRVVEPAACPSGVVCCWECLQRTVAAPASSPLAAFLPASLQDARKLFTV